MSTTTSFFKRYPLVICFAIIYTSLDPGSSGWLMAIVCGAVALLVIFRSKGRLGLSAPDSSSQLDSYRATSTSNLASQ